MGKIVRAISHDGSVRVIFCDSLSIIDRVSHLFDMTPTVTALFGRCLTACSLMSCLLKDEGSSLTLRIKSEGPVGSVVCVGDYKGNVKGYVGDYSVDLPLNSKGKLDVGGAVGKGNLFVIKDIGLKEPYIGTCELVSGEIAEDIAHYFLSSEQTPTACSLGVLVGRDGYPQSSGGYLAQLMPGAEEQTITQLENNCSLLPPVSRLLDSGKTPEQIIDMIFEGIEYEVFDTIDVEYLCNCSKKRYAESLSAVGVKELDEMIADGKSITANCGFCANTYEFSVDELKEIRKHAAK